VGNLGGCLGRQFEVCGGRDDDGVDLLGGDAAGFECFSACRDRHLDDVFFGIGESAVLDAGSRLNPLVAGVDELADLIVGDYPFGAVNAQTEHLRLSTLRCADRTHLQFPLVLPRHRRASARVLGYGLVDTRYVRRRERFTPVR